VTRHKQFQSDGVDARRRRSSRQVARLLAVLVALVAMLATAGTASAEGPQVENTFTCNSVTWTYSGFPEGLEVATVERIKIDHVVVSITNFSFIGPSATSTVSFKVPPGHHEIGATSEYFYKGVHKEHDQFLKGGITCAAEPAYSIEKKQMIAGSGKPFTTEELTGKIGQVVNYQVVVANTGNVKLKFSNFSDPNCDAGTIAGGPGTEPVLPGKSTTYTCNHKLTKTGKYPNAATVTGKAEEFCTEECETTKSSNTVVVTVPAFSIEKLQEIAGSGSGYTKAQLGAEVGQTVNYKVVVTNNSEAPLFFSNFTDEKCDAGTIAGGPGALPVLPGESTTYTCTHLATEADKTAGLLINTASDTGAPEGGASETLTSNPVVVEVPLPKPKVKPEFSCKSVTFNYSGFPNKEGNTVVERIKDNGVLIYSATFVFNGPTATHTIIINLGPGPHHISTTVEFKNFKGEHDQGADVNCTAEPGFSIEKKQRIAKSGKPFSTATVVGSPGQTVEYVIVVKNTGNVPLKFSNFMDEPCTAENCGLPEGCDAGTVKGGPGETAVPPEKPKVAGKTEWTCSHVLTEEDLKFGKHLNKATVTGTPTEGGGGPITKTSNTVVVIDP
jgi:hypothetical protein